MRPSVVILAVAGLLLAGGKHALAWSHQQHILITRLAALRILDDPAAPAGLKTFLRANMTATLADCQELATRKTVGVDAADYLTGLDGMCTLPDRIQNTDESLIPIKPFNQPESKMHFLDLEWFGPAGEPTFKADLSNRPKEADIPHDGKDERFIKAGFLPLRTQQCFGELVTAFREQPMDNAKALHAAGYLAHYLEDATQPQHATVDFRSLSYLAGKVPGIQKVETPLSNGKVETSYRAERAINPHGDLEFQLFENADAPRKTLRQAYWETLQSELAVATLRPADAYDPFARSVSLLLSGYDYLPAIGTAAQEAYASGSFQAGPFFLSSSTVHDKPMTILQVIAHQNAVAVLEVESAYRAAWSQAHPTPP